MMVQGRRLRRRSSLKTSVSENENNYARAFTAFNMCNTSQNLLENPVQENTIISTKEDNDDKDIETGENNNV